LRVINMYREFRKRKALAKRRRAKGITLVWSAIMLIVMIGFLGIVIDMSYVHLTANQLQNAADAAALAGARMIRIDQTYARNQAKYIGGLNTAARDPVFLDLNPYNLSNGDIVIGRYSFTTTPRFRYTGIDGPGLPKPNAMKVVARRIADGAHQPVPLFFGPIPFLGGIDDVNVSRYAIAEAQGGLGAGLLVLSEDPRDAPSLAFNGNPEVDVIDGSIQVNMINPEPPVNLGGSKVIVKADEFNTVSKTDSTDGYVFDPVTGLTLTTGQPKIPDPYRNVPEPIPNPATPMDGSIPTGGTPVTFEAGYYPNGFGKITTGDHVTFMPGVYWVGHKGSNIGLDIQGGYVCAKRVMFYIAPGATIKVTGAKSADITITEINDINPGAGCDGNTITYSQGNAYVAPYRGMSIFQSRSNTNDATVGGGGNFNIEGTIYFPVNHLNLGGTSGSLGIEVIAYTLTIDGTGSGGNKILVSYDGRNRTPAGRAYLVE
jgi:hypothetical protein